MPTKWITHKLYFADYVLLIFRPMHLAEHWTSLGDQKTTQTTSCKVKLIIPHLCPHDQTELLPICSHPQLAITKFCSVYSSVEFTVLLWMVSSLSCLPSYNSLHSAIFHSSWPRYCVGDTKTKTLSFFLCSSNLIVHPMFYCYFGNLIISYNNFNSM